MEMKACETRLALLQKKTENHESDGKHPWTVWIYISYLETGEESEVKVQKWNFYVMNSYLKVQTKKKSVFMLQRYQGN